MMEQLREAGGVINGFSCRTQVSRISLATGAGIRTEPTEIPRIERKSRRFIRFEFWGAECLYLRDENWVSLIEDNELALQSREHMPLF
jgi:hypothetical protein